LLFVGKKEGEAPGRTAALSGMGGTKSRGFQGGEMKAYTPRLKKKSKAPSFVAGVTCAGKKQRKNLYCLTRRGKTKQLCMQEKTVGGTNSINRNQRGEREGGRARGWGMARGKKKRSLPTTFRDGKTGKVKVRN